MDVCIASYMFDLSLAWHQDCVFCLLTSGKVHLIWRVEISKNRFMTRYGLKLLVECAGDCMYDWCLCNVIHHGTRNGNEPMLIFFPSFIYDGGTPKCVSRAHSVIRVKWTIAPDHISNSIILLSAIHSLCIHTEKEESLWYIGTLYCFTATL